MKTDAMPASRALRCGRCAKDGVKETWDVSDLGRFVSIHLRSELDGVNLKIWGRWSETLLTRVWVDLPTWWS